jgi:hypothetical protein
VGFRSWCLGFKTPGQLSLPTPFKKGGIKGKGRTRQEKWELNAKVRTTKKVGIYSLRLSLGMVNSCQVLQNDRTLKKGGLNAKMVGTFSKGVVKVNARHFQKGSRVHTLLKVW